MRAKLLDISYYQGEIDPDSWDVDAVILRSSFGARTDEKFEEYYKLLVDKYPLFVYHYFSSGVDWRVQLEYFAQRIAGKKFCGIWLDLEYSYNKVGESFATAAVKWIEAAKSRFGLPVGFYSGTYFYRDELKPHNYKFGLFDYWVSRYPRTNPDKAWIDGLAESDEQPQLLGRDDYVIWQATDKAVIGNGKKDFNVSFLPRDEFLKVYQVGSSPPRGSDCEELLVIARAEAFEAGQKAERERILACINN